MAINYYDYSDLVEVLGLEEEKGEPLVVIKNHINHSIEEFLKTQNPYMDQVARRCRDWLSKFVNNPSCCMCIVGYRPVWRAILETEDDYSFLCLMEANVHLMWD